MRQERLRNPGCFSNPAPNCNREFYGESFIKCLSCVNSESDKLWGLDLENQIPKY